MDDYLDLKHMSLAKSITTNQLTNYLPHHAVQKPDKWRVVFDGSAKTTNNTSINQQLMVGPKIQEELVSVVLRFRQFHIAFTSDIAKMYRQILVHEDDRNYQRIVYRRLPSEPLKDYILNTVTYGMSSSAFMAIRSLHQCAEDDGHIYPLAAPLVRKHFYVDDLLSGAQTVEKALELQKQFIGLLNGGCFPLRKWASNSPDLNEAIPPQHRQNKSELDLNFDVSQSIQTLGLKWFPLEDTFGFKVTVFNTSNYTKRVVLSETSKLFDPMGWLAPTLISGKILMQSLWKLEIGWDDPLPEEETSEWLHFRNQLRSLENIRIPRWYKINDSSQLQIHGFCDASILAYSAAVYIRCTNDDNQTNVTLVTAKTKVAPLKQISLPKLELCGALLLTRLMNYVKKSLEWQEIPTYYWTDATDVLDWINKPSYHWKIFVANRVSEIQTLTSIDNWKYVPTGDDPADCASRGISAEALHNHSIWWSGPKWLTDDESKWPVRPSSESYSAETEKKLRKTITLASSTGLFLDELISRYSDYIDLKCCTSYLLRYIHNLRSKIVNKTKSIGWLTVAELKMAENCLIHHVQDIHFGEEIQCIKNKRNLPRKSKLISLNPFIDQNGILRVGGRLKHSSLGYEAKHQIILPTNSTLNILILADIHRKCLHGGVQLILVNYRQQFWSIGSRNLSRKIIRRCMACFRQRTNTNTQIMGNLPRERITPSRPFSICGVDFAGPIMLKMSKCRGKTTLKGCICVFTCFAIKAVHLEAVSDMSTEAFIAALRRFTARRGNCKEMHSDCGGNFIGAKRKLNEMLQHLLAQHNNELVHNFLTNDGIVWKFNPPAGPNFGGLWEAAVKSTKHHLKRVMDNILTFKELQTLLCQIECCLNSRPLSALSDDPDDFSVLTPAHFLVGDSLTTIPEPNIMEEKLNRLNRWEIVQQRLQIFWHRWSYEYLHRLQKRPKWLLQKENLCVGDMVVIKEDNIPPSKWILGRILQVFPDDDGQVRVVLVKHKNGSFRRPVTKVSILPMNKSIPESSELFEQ